MRKENICYKSVKMVDGKMVSLFSPKPMEYKIGKITRSEITDDPMSGIFVSSSTTSFRNIKTCIFILKCKYYKPVIKTSYDQLVRVTAVKPIEVYGIVLNEELIFTSNYSDWIINHMAKYPNGEIPPMPFEFEYRGSKFRFNDAQLLKKGEIRKGIKEILSVK